MEYRYYEPELDLDGTADELFVQARNGYIEDKEALTKVAEILRNPAEQKEDKAKYIDILAEIAGDKGNEPYVFAQFKKDILDGVGSEEVTLRDGLIMNVMEDRGSVTVILEEFYPNSMTGAVSVEKDEFLTMSEDKFRELVDAVYYYNMIENEPEETR